MREISNTLEDAILNKKSSSALVRAIIEPSRTFFKALAEDNPYDTTSETYGTPTDDPVGQCMVYSQNMSDVFTFIIDKSTGIIYGMRSASSIKNSLVITGDINTKPFAVDMGNGTANLYYWNEGLYVSTVNLSDWSVSGTQQIAIGTNPNWNIIAGSPTVLAQGQQIILCYKTSKGGIGIALKDGSQWFHWNQRFMSPKALTETVWTIRTSAVNFKGKIYIYSTDMDNGEVRAVEFNASRDAWSDIFIALPADLSRFDITNAVVTDKYVHLAGQYHRTGDYSGAKVYSLVLRSPNGKYFSWDRFTMLSNLGFQFNVGLDSTNKKVYASDRNAIGVADMSYFFTHTPTETLFLEPPASIVSFGTNAETGTMSIAVGNEVYLNKEVIRKGNRVRVEIGYKTEHEDGIEYELYGTYIIDKSEIIWEDGRRSLALQLVNEGVWKTSQIAFPFYAEILSKSSQYDDCDAQDKMYVVPCTSAENVEYLMIDFWNSEEWDTEEVAGTPVSWYEYWDNVTQFKLNFNGTVKGKTIDLNAHPLMNQYPTITGTMDIKLYGWETGLSTSRTPSTFKVYAVTAPEGDLKNTTITEATFVGTYQRFPKENYSPSPRGTANGDYPIEYSLSGLTVGHKLLYFGITATNTSSGDSYIYLERLEIWSGVKFVYNCLTSSSPWELETPPGGDRKYLMSPDTGLQNLMFTTKPYSAFNFNIAAEFGYYAGSNPLSPGTTAWGTVGLAADGQDFICARYKRQTSSLQLILFRNGETTILVDKPHTAVYGIMLDHRNGKFDVYAKVGETWAGPLISHQYDEISNGTLSTSQTGIMHTGVYAAVYPPNFIAAGFAQPYSNGITMTKHQTRASMEHFPSSGFALLDKKKYKYTGKITKALAHNKTYGPYQLRQVSDIGTWNEGGVTYSGTGAEIALFKPTQPPSAVSGLLLGMSNYYNWLISQSDWTVVHSTAGNPDYLLNRSKHYSGSAIADRSMAASTNDKCYISHGLTGITLTEGRSFYHRDGTLCSLWSTDKIWVKKVVATQIDHDATVQDMLQYLSHVASIEAEFPGNWSTDELSVSAVSTELAPDREIFPGGADVRFTLTGPYAVTLTSTKLQLKETEETIEFGIDASSTPVKVFVKFSGTTPDEYVDTDLPSGPHHDIRILVHSEFVSIYANNITLCTLALGEENLKWPDERLDLSVYTSMSSSLLNVSVSELFDWREAIYIESELSISSAIGSVIQERPVEIYATREGNLSFSYRLERDNIEYTNAHSHNILNSHRIIYQNSANAGSDALIYYADITFATYPPYAENDGFNTRVFQLSNLDTGARLAGRLLLEKAYERQTMHSFQIRPDLRLEAGDIVKFTYTVSGTETVNIVRGIIEDINMSVEEGRHAMSVSARDRSLE